MFHKPNYLEASYSLIFPTRKEIRKKDHDFEALLEGRYHQPHILPIPDELDPNLPRMIFGSKHGFSQIVVTQNKISLNVQFSPGEWQSEISKGKRYLIERTPLLFSMLNKVENLEPSYAGCRLRTILGCDHENDVEEVLKKYNIMALGEGQELCDISIRNAIIENNKFYNNITLKNFKKINMENNIEGEGSSSKPLEPEHGLEIHSDFNDRYSYNQNNKYKSDVEIITEIVKGCIKGLETLIIQLKKGL